jgi:glyoxylase-like metal-dependent hydrolase (beta-lactamase superfamily II)
MRYRWIVLVLLIASFALGFVERRVLIVNLMAATGSGEPPPLLEKGDEGPVVRWHDDYFTIEEIAPRTFAIGEPRYAQQNYNYLIVGDSRALLFDAGPGIRNIRRVAESLTEKPIVFLPSHFHYDHVGNSVSFNEIAVVDLPYLRARAKGNRLTLARSEHLGAFEGFNAPTWEIDHWLPVGANIDLGHRSLTLLHTPGHTYDSVSLWDEENGLVFSGDYLYTGELYAFLPNSGMGDYLATSESLLSLLPDNVTFFGAHRAEPPGAPTLTSADLDDLNRSLNGIKDGSVKGEGSYPRLFPVNDRLAILAEPRWLQDWD